MDMGRWLEDTGVSRLSPPFTRFTAIKDKCRVEGFTEENLTELVAAVRAVGQNQVGWTARCEMRRGGNFVDPTLIIPR